ncbi:hypothetical protein MferCBS31731_003735 [Microsporum ferrugineum]
MSLVPSALPRPALLNKTTNALLSPRSHNSEPDMGPGVNVCKQTNNNTPSSPSQVVGQKRSIDQVDVDLHRPSTATSSFNSQNKREDEFYIYDESTHSSMDVDKEASFLQYSHKVSDGQEKGIEKGCSQESTSMSSLLNLSFESDGGNCNNNNINNTNNTKVNSLSNPLKRPQKVARQQTSSSSTIPTDPAARKLFIQQKAGLLREKVQTAMKNIKDHSEIDRRLMELEAQSRRSCNTPSSLGQQQKPSSSHAETGVDVTPKAKPGPSTDPTTQRGDNMGVDNDSTPKQQKVAPQAGASERSQPADSHPLQQQVVSNTGGLVIIDRDGSCSVERMMARAKKETAVDGLLKLMKTTAEYDGLDEWSG